MSRWCPTWIGCGGLVVSLGLLAAGAEARAEEPVPVLAAAAEAARAAGDDARALELYDRVLAADATHQVALRDSARILWRIWRRDESVRRYERLAAVRELDADETGELGSHLVETSAARRALALLEPAAERYPDHRGIRLALAQALVALERRGDARAEARRILEQNPDDVDALNLVAGSYHWGGKAEFAREWYERALAVDPDNFTAQLGLGALDAAVDPEAAETAVENMLARHGHNQWIDGIAASLTGSRRPTVASGFYERETFNERFAVTFGQLSWNLGRARTLELTAARAQSRLGVVGTAEGEVLSGQAVYAFPAGPRRRLTAKGGLALRQDLLGNQQLTPYGSGIWEWGVGGKLRGQVSAGADPYVMAVTSAVGTLDVAGVSALVHRRFASGFSVEASGGAAVLLVKDGPDGNRWESQFKVRREWRLFGRAPADVGYWYSHFEHPEPVRTPGYFAPRRFSSHNLYAGFSGAVPPRLSGRRVTFSVSGIYSRMRYGSISDSSFNVTGMLALHVGNGLELGGLLIRSNGSLTVGWPASQSTQLGLGLRFVPPRRARN